MNKLNGKLYIGQTTKSASKRFKEHCYKSSLCMCVSRSIQKYGKENFEIKVISRCNSMEEMNHREQYYIKLFNTLAPNGYNLRGGGGKNEILSRESSDKIATSNGSKLFKVFEIKTNKLIWEGVSQNYCARVLDLDQANVGSCLRLKRKSHKGYIFRYVGEEDLLYKEKNGVKRSIQNVETKEIFNSITNAALKHSVNGSNIYRAINTGTACGGYHWKYIEKNCLPFKSKNRKIQNVETGQIFDGVRVAARLLGLDNSHIARAARTHSLAYGYHWRYI